MKLLDLYFNGKPAEINTVVKWDLRATSAKPPLMMILETSEKYREEGVSIASELRKIKKGKRTIEEVNDRINVK